MDWPKVLLVTGIIMLLSGAIWMWYPKAFSWVGKLPGDFMWRGEGFRVYIPLASMLLISLALNLLWWLFRWIEEKWFTS